MKRLLEIAAISALAFVSSPVLAVTTFQTNFDTVPVSSGGYIIVSSVEGWNAASGAGIELQNHAAGDPFSESNLVELDSDNNSSMSRTIDPGSYNLKFFYSARPGIPASSNGIDVLVNGTSIFNITGNGGSNTNWLKRAIKFEVSDSATLTFAATGTDDSLGGYLDNIGLSSAVPEAATWAMMMAGFGFMGMAARRRQKVRVTFA